MGRAKTALTLVGFALAQFGCVTAAVDPAPVAIGKQGAPVRPVAATAEDTLTVLTLNLAHGRAGGFHQIFQSAATARRNLDAVAALVRRESPHLVALQEADGPSIWSGGFCHPCRVADGAGYDFGWHGLHARGPGLTYGTALLSRSPLDQSAKQTFSGRLFTTPKGITSAVLRWPGRLTPVDVVSLHLDALRPAVRRAQMAWIVAAYQDRRRPLILLGDFNTTWSPDLAAMAANLDVGAWRPEQPQLATFPRFGGRRLDWVLVSPEIDFVEYRVLPDRVSDHRAVLARLALRAERPVESVAALQAPSIEAPAWVLPGPGDPRADNAMP